ncbi:MAG: hypothetical protein ABEJ93_03865 [Candidatus Nanohalobium sp.]
MGVASVVALLVLMMFTPLLNPQPGLDYELDVVSFNSTHEEVSWWTEHAGNSSVSKYVKAEDGSWYRVGRVDAGNGTYPSAVVDIHSVKNLNYGGRTFRPENITAYSVRAESWRHRELKSWTVLKLPTSEKLNFTGKPAMQVR